MSLATLVLGESGSGKSTSLRNLDPAATLLIQVVRKPLPFRSKGWGYRTAENPGGNVFVTDDWQQVIAIMKRTQRDVIVIDDVQYLLANEFMKRSDETGFQKFTDIGKHAWEVFTAAASLPDHKRVYLLSHTQTDDFGHTKAKTIGKLLDEKITVEGLFTIVLRTVVDGGQYHFSTRNSGADTVKAPLGLFEHDRIDNDLALVDAAIYHYYDLKTPAHVA